MASTGLKGPHQLSSVRVALTVTRKSPGAYALGKLEGETFYVKRIGRSDTDLAQRLTSYVSKGKYTHFKYEYYPSPKAAFEKECSLYHDFNPADNDLHPDRPNGSGWKCPRCRLFD